MYTQGPKCEPVFRLAAEALRAAGGQVRCGRCGEIFSALARLAEDPAVFERGESALELEARADAILEAARATSAAVAPIDADEDTGEQAMEASLEFTLPPGELDRIFVDSRATPLEEEFGHAGIAAAREEHELPVSGLEVPEHVRRDMLAAFEQATTGDGNSSPGAAAAAAGVPTAPVLEPAAAGGPAPRPPPAPLAVNLAAAPARLAATATAPSRARRAGWLTAAALLALLLAVQVTVDERDWLAGHTPFGAALGAFYTRLGVVPPPPPSLAAYQLRQWGVTGDPTANGTLHVRASILNTAAQMQPFPLLRVTLQNRFGAALGSRDFAPTEYLGRPTARLMAPGERMDATLAIKDPGKDAEGFEIDVCLRTAERRVACAADGGTPAAK